MTTIPLEQQTDPRPTGADYLLHMAPGSCSRVPLVALLECDANFETVLVRFMKGEHKTPAYKMLNPKGKVPVLVAGGEVLTENVAILFFLSQRFPGLLPKVDTPLDVARQIADLTLCSATLHPLVTRIRMPAFFASPEAVGSVREKAIDAMREQLQPVEDRLDHRPWWYGDSWSVMDAYLGWVFWRIEGAGFPVSDYPRLIEHHNRLSGRPSHRRAMVIEDNATAMLEAEGLAFRPAPPANS